MNCKYCNGEFILKKEKYTFMEVEYLLCEKCKFTELNIEIIKEWKKKNQATQPTQPAEAKEEKKEIMQTAQAPQPTQQTEKKTAKEEISIVKYKITFKPEKIGIFEEKTIEVDEKTNLIMAGRLAGINIDEKNDTLIIRNGKFMNRGREMKANPEELCVVSASWTYPLSDLDVVVPLSSLSKDKGKNVEKKEVEVKEEKTIDTKKFKITFEREIEGKIVSDSCEIDGKTNLLLAAGLLNININAPCGGQGVCKKCKVLIKSGEFLNKGETINNYVLACQVYPKSDLTVFIPKESIGEEDTSQILMDNVELGEVKGDVGFAVDIGTTTIVAYLVDLSTKKIVAGEGCYNPQRVYGGDVIARMDYAKKSPENRKELQKLVINAINKLVAKLIKRKNLKIEQIKKYVISGNVVMTYLFLGKDTEEIRFNPNSENYKKFYSGKAKELNLIGNEDTEYLTVPGIGAYVGGDISSDILCTEILDSENFCMLVDIGTNGQIVIGNKDMLLACSTSAGPAFEGGGIEYGMRASEGAIEDVKIEGDKIYCKVIGNVSPRGICGSGLINLISEMFKNEIINYKGEIDINNEKFRDRFIVDKETGNNKFIIVKAEENNGKEICISNKDIENLIYAKAAIYTGIYTLLQISGISFESIKKIYIAGGFGNSIDFSKATDIGLFPKLDLGKFVFIGNGSAKGSSLILTDENFKKKAETITKISTYIDLASNKIFNEEYVKAIYIPHLELDRFK
ncbi:MAG: ASKHA domain-containing protein [Candidatus Altarchaeaceae archaeon]